MPQPTKRSLWMTVIAAGAASVLAAGLAMPTRAVAQTPPAAPATPAKTKTALFNMYCYWTGEARGP